MRIVHRSSKPHTTRISFFIFIFLSFLTLRGGEIFHRATQSVAPIIKILGAIVAADATGRATSAGGTAAGATGVPARETKNNITIGVIGVGRYGCGIGR